jgi:hypothetical protein
VTDSAEQQLYFDPESPKILPLREDEVALHPAVLPLGHLLVASEFNYEKGDFPIIHLSDWGPEKGLEVGKQVAAELAEQVPPAKFTQEIIKRLHILGVFPDFNYVRRHYGSLGNYVEAIGGIPSQDTARYDKMSRHELLRYIVDGYREAGFTVALSESMIETMHQLQMAPHVNYVWKRLGGVREINDTLGYPNIREWGPRDYLKFGAQVLRLNGIDSLTVSNMLKLAQMHLGPYPTTIKAKFGSWGTYRNLAVEEYKTELAHEAARAKLIKDYYTEHAPETAAEVSFNAMARFRAIRLISEYYKLTTPPGSRAHIKTVGRLVATIQEQRPDISMGDIEATAVFFDVFDELWPTQPTLHPPILPR